jgi:transposase
MKILTIGIDVSKSKLDIQTSDNKFAVIGNNKTAITDYFKQFKEVKTIKKSQAKETKIRIILEATGKYHRLAHHILFDMGLEVMVINPYQSRNFARAMNLNCKTDKVDAKMLCLYGQTIPFKNKKTLSPKQELLQELSRRKEQLLGDYVREVNRLKSAHQNLTAAIQQHIDFIKDRITDLDQELNNIVIQDSALKQKLEILTSTPGVGKTSALTLLSCLPELGLVSRRQISSLTGLAPINNDSGTSKGKRSIQKGRKQVRQSLYMPILNAIRNNHTIKKFYQHLKQQGKAGKVAITACMRKLITILNLMLKNNTKWEIIS